ncbi:phage holin family protein [uncultured Aquitalea sp.]|uniref:phage holin family protein n=1 Tax=uncultured Aquitalea sp. TaxID=540272 RepID=UPI0025DBC747|nr:phage holin family protein [uncultured Aquitalea sp.]
MLNALVCATICLRLLFYRRDGARHKPVMAWLAYVLVVATGWVVIQAVFGRPIPVGMETLVINSVLCVAVWVTRGNVSAIFWTPKPPPAWDGINRRKETRHGAH